MSSWLVANSKVWSDKSFVDDLTASGYCKRWEWALSYDPLRFIPCCRDLCFLLAPVYCGSPMAILIFSCSLCVLWFYYANLGFPVEQTMPYVDSGVYAHLFGVGGKVSRRTPWRRSNGCVCVIVPWGDVLYRCPYSDSVRYEGVVPLTNPAGKVHQESLPIAWSAFLRETEWITPNFVDAILGGFRTQGSLQYTSNTRVPNQYSYMFKILVLGVQSGSGVMSLTNEDYLAPA